MHVRLRGRRWQNMRSVPFRVPTGPWRIKPRELQRRYGYLLDCLWRNGRFNAAAEPGSHTTPANVELYLAEIKERLSSVTVYNSICKIRRLTQLIAPAVDLAWL